MKVTNAFRTHSTGTGHIMINKTDFYIDGKWVAPQQGTALEVIDPSTEDAFATISLGGEADTNAAVAAAKRAFPAWSKTPPAERLALVKKIQEIYKSRMDDMAAAISQEMGAPIDMAKQQQAPAGLGHITNFIKAAENFEFVRPLGDHAPNDRIVMDPAGVIAMITPWNWPLNQIACKVAPAIAAGCTMILKPSEYTPSSALIFAEILHEAGVPKGVFNLVNGLGPDVGVAMSEHPGIDMISFTGSTRAGIDVAKRAANTVKRVSQELGGVALAGGVGRDGVDRLNSQVVGHLCTGFLASLVPVDLVAHGSHVVGSDECSRGFRDAAQQTERGEQGNNSQECAHGPSLACWLVGCALLNIQAVVRELFGTPRVLGTDGL